MVRNTGSHSIIQEHATYEIKKSFSSPHARSQSDSHTHISTASPTVKRKLLRRLHTLKMASQRSADNTHCAILTLPDELLLEFFSHLPHLPRDRRGDLVALSTVDKRIGGIAIEQLHTSVYLNVQNVETLLALYNKRPHLAKLVKSLDLYDQGSAALVGHWWCRSKTIHTCHAYRAQEKSYQTSMIAYLDLAMRSGLPESVQKGLRQGLQDLDLDAFLTLLLTAVPNLQHLFLGGLENLEFLKSSIVIDRTRALVLPQMQYASRLARIYERLAVTLKTL